MFTCPLPPLCPLCGLRECRHYLGTGAAGRRLFQTEQEIIEQVILGGGKMLRLTGRVYLNSDKTKVVKHGDPDAAFLLGGRGALISEADAKRLGVSATEEVTDVPVTSGVAPLRAQLAAVPSNPDDDSLYDDQSERGKKARADAREMQRAPIEEYVLSTGGSEEDAERVALEASGQASPQGPSVDEQRAQNAALRDEGKTKK